MSTGVLLRLMNVIGAGVEYSVDRESSSTVAGSSFLIPGSALRGASDSTDCIFRLWRPVNATVLSMPTLYWPPFDTPGNPLRSADSKSRSNSGFDQDCPSVSIAAASNQAVPFPVRRNPKLMLRASGGTGNSISCHDQSVVPVAPRTIPSPVAGLPPIARALEL